MIERTAIAPAIAIAAGLLSAPAAAATVQLEPFQMVRSLQLVQDRIADGEHAAVAMQRKILELIDERLRASKPEDFADGRNFRALMIYAMSGGNPATVDKIVSRLILDERDARLSAGLLQYVKGHPGSAVSALREIDPRTVPADIGPSLALVKGMLFASIDAGQSLGFLDYARLAGPGTLVEEAALRRSLSISATIGDADRFLRASEQYVRRFLRSPYASQFADAFVEGISMLHDKIDLEKVAATIEGMNPEQERVIYLRIARQAVIERQTALLAFARNGLEASSAAVHTDDPRATLYSALAQVASPNVVEVRETLETIDPAKLSLADRALLEAAKAIVDEVVTPPTTAAVHLRRSEPGDIALPESPAETSADGSASAASNPTEDFVALRRSQLEAIDELLQENTQ